MLKSLLQGMSNVTHSPEYEFYEGHPNNLKDDFYRLGQIRPNQFGAGHVYYSPEWLYMLQRLGMKHVFIYRDPRDTLISFVYFIVEKYPQHPLHEHLSKELQTQKDRYLALIRGVNNGRVQYPNFAAWFRPFQGWIEEPYTFSLTFEELTQSDALRRLTLARLASHLWEGMTPQIPFPDMIKQMEERMDPKYSLTYRSGKIGNWKEEFDEEVKETFKGVAGDLLIQLGYEVDRAW